MCPYSDTHHTSERDRQTSFDMYFVHAHYLKNIYYMSSMYLTVSNKDNAPISKIYTKFERVGKVLVTQLKTIKF